MSWLERWKQRREDAKYRDGYRWAAGELLRTKDINVVLNWVDLARDIRGVHSFDRGARKAVEDFMELVP